MGLRHHRPAADKDEYNDERPPMVRDGGGNQVMLQYSSTSSALAGRSDKSYSRDRIPKAFRALGYSSRSAILYPLALSSPNTPVVRCPACTPSRKPLRYGSGNFFDMDDEDVFTRHSLAYYPYGCSKAR